MIPGKASESLLYRAIAHEGDLKMPPGKTLPLQQVRMIREWIETGAPFGESASGTQSTWWSFQKPVRAPVNSIDDLARPKAPQAGRRVLIRRATFDLTGLPPDPKTSRRSSTIPIRRLTRN